MPDEQEQIMTLDPVKALDLAREGQWGGSASNGAIFL